MPPSLALALTLSCLGASCLSRSAAARLYALPAAPRADVTTAPRANVAFVLPGYLQRTEMRLFDESTGEVRRCPGGLWAAPLQELLSEALAAELGADRAIVVQCRRFAPGFDGRFQACGSLCAAGEPPRPFEFTLPALSDGHPAPADIARQYRDAVQKLSELYGRPAK